MSSEQRNPIDVALEIWPDLRDGNNLQDLSHLDILLGSLGIPTAYGSSEGISTTFGGFTESASPTVTLPTGETTTSLEEAKLLCHIVVTRTLMSAGLDVDRRVQEAMGQAYANTWCVKGDYKTTPLVLSASLWLIALDSQSHSDTPLPIDWSASIYENSLFWDTEYRLFSHYDIKERALDWVVHVSHENERHQGCSRWNIIEPLLRIEDERADLAVTNFLNQLEEDAENISARYIIERSRIAKLT